MTSIPDITDSTRGGEPCGAMPLRDRLRALGIVLFACEKNDASNGSVELGDADAVGEDWLVTLLARSPVFREAAHRATQTLVKVESCGAVRSFPGCWLVPLSRTTRRRARRESGCDVAVILTQPLLQSEQLAAMCQAARLDLELCKRMLEALPLASEADVARLSSLIRQVHEEDVHHRASAEAMESVGQQLAESYEEINLLYTIIQSMTVEESPERFLRFVCEELLGTLPFSWIGVVMQSDQGRFKSIAGELILAGTPTEELNSVREASLKTLLRASPDVPMVLEPVFNPEHAAFAALGHNALVHPVKHNGKVAGVLIAGEKRGADRAVSSVDMKLINATATHVSIYLENASLYDNLNAMFLGTLEALTASIDAKDRYTCGHSQRVAHLTRALAEELGHDEAALQRMHIAGLVHDVGKIGVPESVLLKPGRLTQDEFAWIRLHPEIGYRILKDIPQLKDVLPGVLHHHERWDGRGYPHGLAGTQIPLLARLIALADSFDAMSSSRTYREAMSRPKVLEEIRRNAGTQFDPDLVPAFLRLDFSDYDRLVIEHRATEQHLRAPGEAA